MTPLGRLKRWAWPRAEALAAAAFAALLGQWGVREAAEGVIFAVVPLLGAVGAALYARAAFRRVGLGPGGPGDGPGILRIQEGRILYMGPETGGVAALDALVAVDAAPGPGGSVAVWRLVAADGAALEIPSGAIGAGALTDTLGALPGFDLGAVTRAMAARPKGYARVWSVPAPGRRALGRS